MRLPSLPRRAIYAASVITGIVLFLKFCGLDLATYQSGKYRGQTRLSKFGNAPLRRAMWLAAQVAIRQKENSFRDKFERYVAKDRRNADLNRKALSAVAAKMVASYTPSSKAAVTTAPSSRWRCRAGEPLSGVGREGALATL